MDSVLNATNKRERIAQLLDEHDLTLMYENIFDRWIFTLYDSEDHVLLKRKGINLKALRDELLQYLENYDNVRPKILPGEEHLKYGAPH
jgi:hypothetical protein